MHVRAKVFVFLLAVFDGAAGMRMRTTSAADDVLSSASQGGHAERAVCPHERKAVGYEKAGHYQVQTRKLKPTIIEGLTLRPPRVLSAFREGLVGFNPAIVQIPAGKIKDSLGPTAAYLAVLRQGSNQCEVFQAKYKQDGDLTSLVVLDKNLCVVNSTTIYLLDEENRKLSIRKSLQNPSGTSMEDARLLVKDGQVWIGYMEFNAKNAVSNIRNAGSIDGAMRKYNLMGRYHFTRLWIEVASSKLDAHVKTAGDSLPSLSKLFTHSKRAKIPSKYDHYILEGRNHGFFVHGGQVHSIDWIDPFEYDIVKTRPDNDGHEGGQKKNATVRRSSGFRISDAAHTAHTLGHDIHNNGNLLELEEHGLLLGVAHTHYDYTPKQAKWGANYVHYFYAVENKPPFKLMSLGERFCVQSSLKAGDCEVIQYVGSVTRAVDNPDRLLLAYGVNDCEAKVIDVSISDVVAGLKSVSTVGDDSAAPS